MSTLKVDRIQPFSESSIEIVGGVASASTSSYLEFDNGQSISAFSSSLAASAAKTLVSGSGQISHDSTTGFVANEHIDHSGVDLTAGAGLTGGGDITTSRTFAIGAGDGITVNTDDIQVDSSVVRTTGDQSIGGSKTFTGDNSFSGTQTFLNLAVNGTGSFAYIQSVTGSAKVIGDAFLVLNQNTPAERFGGLRIVDSGSEFTTSSFIYDGLNNQWLFQHEGSADSGSSIAIFGPLNSGSLGEEVGLTQHIIPRAGVHGHHIVDSGIKDDGATISLANDTVITGSLTVSGTATVNTLVESSDRIFKDNIETIPSQLNTIMGLNPVTFNWKGTSTKNYGFVLDEVEELYPELVDKDNKGIQYSKIVSILTKGIQELHDTVKTQQYQIEQLTKKLNK